MICSIQIRGGVQGVLDRELIDGDVIEINENNYTPGGFERNLILAVLIPDPSNLAEWKSELLKTDYSIGATTADIRIRRARAYQLVWRPHFSTGELVTIDDPSQSLPDGQLLSGGQVINGVVHNKFTTNDFLRKN